MKIGVEKIVLRPRSFELTDPVKSGFDVAFV